MRELEISNLELISGGTLGDAVDGLCIGFGVVAGGYAIGAALNWWNPVGWAGGVVLGVVGVGCAVNGLT